MNRAACKRTTNDDGVRQRDVSKKEIEFVLRQSKIASYKPRRNLPCIVEQCVVCIDEGVSGELAHAS